MPPQPIESIRLQSPFDVDSGGMETSAEVKRIVGLLERLIAFQKVPISTIEKRMKVSQGYLARVFRGESYLRYQHVLDVLEAIELPPRGFFKLAYEIDGAGDSDLRALASLPAVAKPQEPVVTLSEADLEALLQKALSKFDLVKLPSPSTGRSKTGKRRPRRDD